MNIWPIDFNKTLEEINEWFDSWKAERFGSDSLNPERYYKVTPDEKGRYLYGVAEGESLNDEKAKCDEVLDLLLNIKQINDKLSGRALSHHLQWKEREQLKREREGLYKEFLDEVQADFENQQPKPKRELIDLLPDQLKSDEVVIIFQRAIDAKMIEKAATGLKWKNTKQLLAYFATRISDKFSLTTRFDKDGNKTTDWKTFETLFGEQGLKGAKQNWMRLNTKFEPTGFEKVDALF